MQIAIQGELGSFSHEAALRMANGLEPGNSGSEDIQIVPCFHSPDVFRLVVEGTVDAAVIPIENSLAGPVAEHFDLLLKEEVAIESESQLRIRHNLIGLPSATLARIKRVSSHPVALAQCRRFLESHPEILAVPFYDTAGSVKTVIEKGELSAAAIASRQAADHYGAHILAADIEDNAANFTRFFLVRRADLVRPDREADKVSLAFTVENRPGTLVEALRIFAVEGTNLTKIESRPVQGRPWQYVFYVDYQMATAASADTILAALRRSCSMVKELGRYRSAPMNFDNQTN
ncbi:Prephenate dehydratase [Acidisarcina polymorpha]|uniref:Prephenate dehydratase n=1 Tax=Acidisarcina polymorpha TaxID=2211140 RepID=A0A2Z5G7F5_9BACT|nr:prephenate dehydratase [Acidisarcina polymorpha]AXC15182.1 Prephenate dehydratase [Acidisarcina polymorpha]